MKERQKKAVANSVCASDNRLTEDGTYQSPSSFSIVGGKHPKGKPTVTITTSWTEVEPNSQLKKLFRLLLSPKNKA